MKKLIEIAHQEHLVECDNPQCDYTVKNPTGDPYEDIGHYLNVPCPKCGENLLTEEDYAQSQKILRVVKWLNKWFSWLTVFSSNKTKYETLSVKCHNGVKIEKSK